MSANHVRFLGLADPALVLNERVAAPGQPPYQTLDLTLEQAALYLWVVRQWELEFSYTAGSLSGTILFQTNRSGPGGPTPTSERDLLSAHRNPYTRYSYFDGIGDFTSGALALDSQFYHEAGVYSFIVDLALNSLKGASGGEPSVAFFIGMLSGMDSTPVDLTIEFAGYSFVLTAHVFCSVGGVPAAFTISPLVVRAISYWQHESVSGLPVYDTSTGTMLNDPLS